MMQLVMPLSKLSALSLLCVATQAAALSECPAAPIGIALSEGYECAECGGNCEIIPNCAFCNQNDVADPTNCLICNEGLVQRCTCIMFVVRSMGLNYFLLPLSFPLSFFQCFSPSFSRYSISFDSTQDNGDCTGTCVKTTRVVKRNEENQNQAPSTVDAEIYKQLLCVCDCVSFPGPGESFCSYVLLLASQRSS